ncbi:hypothetical protein [Neoroseomonas rubea]|uniref:hypothetical protein n=1 Tax=Neoroseomonas rubea TaxID=2748666 RepID=UPI0018DF0D38|nr:hypothetical protein [Roseomonas rubea]
MGLDLAQAASARFEDPRPESSDARARVAAARDYRDGPIIATVSLCPLRVKNLLGVEIGGQLRMSARRATLTFAGTETKTCKPIDHSWPPILLPHLERYLAEVRPILLTSTAPVDPA